MRVLLSAYACEPDRGSEPGAGFRALLAAAGEHEVWVLTRANNRAALERALHGHPRREQIHLETFDLSSPLRFLKKRLGIVGMHLYYALWQRKAGRLAVSLDAAEDFDVVHHATFANYWTSTGVATVDKPIVWGPIGGGVDTPACLRTELGVRGRLIDRARSFGRAIFYFLSRQPSGAVVLAQNQETLERLGGHSSSRVVPNALAVEVPPMTDVEVRSDVVLVGRLIPWKGVALAVRAFSLVDDPRASLTIFGDGPDRDRLLREIARLGLGGRVRLAGSVSRADLLRTLASAEAMLHTAFREEAGWAVAEALSYGTPVICLEIGGPKVLTEFWNRSPIELIPVGEAGDVAARLAKAIDRVLSASSVPVADPIAPAMSYREAILDAYAAAVATR